MRFCSKLSSVAVCCLGVLALSGTVSGAPRVRSVVRADSRSGRLVRAVIVSPRIVQPVVVNPSTPVEPNGAVVPANADVPEIVEATARKYDVDPLLVHSVIQVESGYNPYAVSPKGALGLMQLMPGTARRFGVENAFDVRDNIDGGVRYLSYLQTLFPHDLRLALAAYNAGEGAVWKYNNRIPPYRETEHYVYKVGKKYGEAKRAKGDTVIAARPPQPAVENPATASAQPAYAPLEYFVDAEGRIHMRTVGTAEKDSPELNTP